MQGHFELTLSPRHERDPDCRRRHGGQLFRLLRHTPGRAHEHSLYREAGDVSGLSLDKVVDGKIVESIVEVDLEDILGQIGAVVRAQPSEEANPT